MITKNLLCPKCLSRDIRPGVGVSGPDDYDMEIRSFDRDLVQCRSCGSDDEMVWFEDRCPRGCLQVAMEKAGRGLRAMAFSQEDLPVLMWMSNAYSAKREGCLEVRGERGGVS